jgi:glutaredoxin
MPLKIALGAFALLLAVSFAAHAQMYRWTDKQGRVHYTDTPPPKDALKAQEKNLRSNTSSGGEMSYETQEAMKKYPVKLFTAEKCDPCTEGRSLLSKRGIPFREIVVKDDASRAELKKVNDKGEVPVLIVGTDVRKGYEAGNWNSALDGAGYPKTPMPGVKMPDPAAAPKTETEAAAPKGPYSP